MKIIRVENCYECPYSFSHIGLNGMRCKKYNRGFIEVTKAYSIPDWCPLEDAPPDEKEEIYCEFCVERNLI
jgi:hypothetical protein